MFIHTFPSGPFSTNAYLAACPKTQQAAIIDPAPDSFSMIQDDLTAHHLTPKMILLTHSHWDHIADVFKFKAHFAIPVYVHPLDAPNLIHPGADHLPCWLDFPSIQPDLFLEEGMKIPIGELVLQVLHTPGHSPGSVCFYEPHHHILFSGDTLFQGTIGNLSFPTSRPDLMWDSLAKLVHLPPETKVYPGHGPATTLREEAHWLKNARDLFDV